ncbi:hypothetical protein QUF79_14510 [Fictibacillus enclensis]|uniref:hypothetical protein n=1 Tax=Fictibacillus enclensis TaxID=1017270 RepID=UPI0025A0D085|nr:hypothetical protein [Fictibacillus enclensis]MDM5199230.1 hypothetical protein [Fictibacillus enclensis]
MNNMNVSLNLDLVGDLDEEQYSDLNYNLFTATIEWFVDREMSKEGSPRTASIDGKRYYDFLEKMAKEVKPLVEPFMIDGYTSERKLHSAIHSRAYDYWRSLNEEAHLN